MLGDRYVSVSGYQGHSHDVWQSTLSEGLRDLLTSSSTDDFFPSNPSGRQAPRASIETQVSLVLAILGGKISKDLLYDS